jgi:hypothetical protein
MRAVLRCTRYGYLLAFHILLLCAAGRTPTEIAAAAETINAERQCCRFLRFVLTIEPGDGPIWLEITGPQGTSALLESLLQGDNPR